MRSRIYIYILVYSVYVLSYPLNCACSYAFVGIRFLHGRRHIICYRVGYMYRRRTLKVGISTLVRLFICKEEGRPSLGYFQSNTNLTFKKVLLSLSI